jgi:uncharacterized protein YciI
MKEDRMFIGISTYLKPLEELDTLYPAHFEWIMKYYTSGVILGSGPRVPRTGGVLIGRAESLEAFRALLDQDPFVQHGVAHYEIVEFSPGPLPRRAAELEAFLSRPILTEQTTS